MGLSIPEQYGGAGLDDYRYYVVVHEEAARANVHLGTLRAHLDIVLPYLLAYANDEQRQRWLPGLATGDLFLAIAMTEPGTGSDLAGVKTTATRDGDHYVINGGDRIMSDPIHWSWEASRLLYPEYASYLATISR